MGPGQRHHLASERFRSFPVHSAKCFCSVSGHSTLAAANARTSNDMRLLEWAVNCGRVFTASAAQSNWLIFLPPRFPSPVSASSVTLLRLLSAKSKPWSPLYPELEYIRNHVDRNLPLRILSHCNFHERITMMPYPKWIVLRKSLTAR